MQPEPTLEDLLKDLWQAKGILLKGAGLGLVLAVVVLFLAVPHYRAEMLVAPAERGTGPDIKALLPDNSSFAVQYMMNAMGSADSGDFIRFEHILRGPSVAKELLKDERFIEGYRQTKSFRFQLKRSGKVTAQHLSDFLMAHVNIDPVGNTPLRRLVFLHPDRNQAGYMLRRLHEVTDGIIRQEIRDKTHKREDYLQDALVTVDHPDHRRALTSLLMEQEHVRMILAMDEPFAAIIAEPPAAGVQPYWPRGSMILPVFMLGGMVLGYAFYTLRRKAAS